MINNIDHLSFSSMRMHQRCPRQYYFRYVLGIKAPPSVKMGVGKCSNDAIIGDNKGEIAGNFRQKIQTGNDLRPNQVTDMFRDLFRGRKEKWDWTQEQKDENHWEKGTTIAIEEYIKTVAATVQPMTVQDEFRVEFENYPALIGYIDFEDMGNNGKDNTLVEMKLKSKKMSDKQIADDQQITCYDLGYKQKYGKRPKRREYQVLLVGKKQPQLAGAERTEAHLNHFLWAFAEIVKAIGAGIFPRCDPENWNCDPKWCGYYSKCFGKK